jgi:hypothetical protein
MEKFLPLQGEHTNQKEGKEKKRKKKKERKLTKFLQEHKVYDMS